MLRFLQPFRKNVQGSLSALFVLSAIPALATVGIALDYSRMSGLRAHLQAAADAAALAAVVLPSSERNVRASAIVDAYMKLYTNSKIDKIYTEPGSGKYEIKLSTIVDKSLTGLISQDALAVSVKSVAYVPVAAQPSSSGADVCFLMTSPNLDGALRVNSNANVDLGKCEAHVMSNHSQGFIINANSTFIAPRICVKGQARNNGGNLGSGKIEENCTPMTDPFAGTLPVVTYDSSLCQTRIIDKDGMNVPADQTVIINGQSVALGCHNDINVNGNVKDMTFAPGIHVINGNANLMGKVTAKNVTFYMTCSNSGFQMNGNTEFYASAPTTGPTLGILFYQDPYISTTKTLVFNAKGGQTLEGLIYLPSFDIHFRSTVKAGTTDKVTWVSNTFIADSSSKWMVETSSRKITNTNTSVAQSSSKPPILVR